MIKNIVLDELGISQNEIIETIEGGNSDVLKYQDSRGNLRAIKIYKGSEARIDQMFSRETSTLKFLNQNDFLNIPQDFRFFENLKVISYLWIDGSNPDTDQRALSSIFEMIRRLHKLSKTGVLFDNAIDAAFSPSDIVAQIEARIRNFETSVHFKTTNIEERLNRYRCDFQLLSQYEYLTLSLSDIGTHNIIRQPHIDIFIDFEFFGFDSVAKMLGDFLLHPRNRFSSKDILRHQQEIPQVGSQLQNEILDSLPLLAIKWSLITLGRADRINGNDSHSILKRNELQSKSESYLRYFDYVVSRDSKESTFTFNEFELGQAV